jgi:site-specific DNA-cytosine methylase
MKILYLAAFKAYHPQWSITYQDINGKRDIDGCMLEVDITPYDVIIATPPCNYYSRANYRRLESDYSQKTKHLLPSIVFKLQSQDKPYIIENVINVKLMKGIIKNFKGYYYEIGRHSYFTNIPFNMSNIKQETDIIYKIIKSGKNKGHKGDFTPRSKRQGGDNVNQVIEHWLTIVKEEYKKG